MILAFIFLIIQPNAVAKNEKYHFEKVIKSKAIKTICDFSNEEENGLLSIKIKYKNKLNSFYIWKGIDHETCIDLAFQIKKLKQRNNFLKIVGNDPSTSVSNNEVNWNWKYIRTNHECVSYLTNYCLPENHPHKMR